MQFKARASRLQTAAMFFLLTRFKSASDSMRRCNRITKKDAPGAFGVLGRDVHEIIANRIVVHSIYYTRNKKLNAPAEIRRRPLEIRRGI